MKKPGALYAFMLLIAFGLAVVDRTQVRFQTPSGARQEFIRELKNMSLKDALHQHHRADVAGRLKVGKRIF